MLRSGTNHTGQTVGFFRRKRAKLSLSQELVKVRRERVPPQPDKIMSIEAKSKCVIAIVDDQPDWDYSLDENYARENAISGAAYYNIAQPFSPDEQSLFEFLIRSLAGRKIAIYAWGVYVDINGEKPTL